MKYQFVRGRENYEDYASGRVLLGMPGNPAFPVRLASEVFQRCVAVHAAEGRVGPFRLYDPCCGAAYHLAVIGYMHLEQVWQIVGSDIDPSALALAERNLAMLSLAGLERRIAELTAMRDAFGKSSHVEALASADRLRARLLSRSAKERPRTRLFLADATDQASLKHGFEGESIDIVFVDVPYGWHSEWRTEVATSRSGLETVGLMLEALLGIVSGSTVVAVAADKTQQIGQSRYERLQRLKVGKRQVVILKPLAGA